MHLSWQHVLSSPALSVASLPYITSRLLYILKMQLVKGWGGLCQTCGDVVEIPPADGPQDRILGEPLNVCFETCANLLTEGGIKSDLL